MVIASVAFLFYADLRQMLGIFTWKFVSFVQWIYIVALYRIKFDMKKLQNSFSDL